MSLSTDLAQGWIEAPLRELIQPRGEKILPAEMPAAKFIGMDHVEAHTTRILGYAPARSVRSAAAIFRKGDVLYGRLRPYLNKVATPEFDGLASAEFIVFPDTQLVRSNFLKHRLNALDFVSFVSHLNEGDRPRVGFDDIGSFRVRLPPPAEQTRIVAKIEELFSELDKGVESLTTAREQLKVYRQAVLKHAFEGKLTADWRSKNQASIKTPDELRSEIQRGRQTRYEQELARTSVFSDESAAGQRKRIPAKPQPTENSSIHCYSDLPSLPTGWAYVPFEDIALSIRNGISQKPNETGELKVFRISAVRPMSFDLSDFRHIDELEEYERYRLRINDLVFTRYNGSRAYVGVAALYTGDESHVYPDKLIRCDISSDFLDPRFLEKAVNCGQSRTFIESRIRTTAGQAGISGGDLKGMPVAICSKEEQIQIRLVLDAQLSLISRLESDVDRGLEMIAVLRQSILQKAFSGQLVPQDPNDEPASVLLDRIKAEKEADATSKTKPKKLKAQGAAV